MMRMRIRIATRMRTQTINQVTILEESLVELSLNRYATGRVGFRPSLWHDRVEMSRLIECAACEASPE